jgi:hypothetical protein
MSNPNSFFFYPFLNIVSKFQMPVMHNSATDDKDECTIMDVYYMVDDEYREVMMPLNSFNQKIVEAFKKDTKLPERLHGLKHECRTKPVVQYNTKK